MAIKITVLNKSFYFADIFLKKSATVLFKYSNINENTIDLEIGKQLFHGLIYSLALIKLKTLKTYIKTNLANSFIWPSKSCAEASNLFVQKLNGCFCLCVNYCSLNNFKIKNWYLLPLISELFDQLGQAKQFI